MRITAVRITPLFLPLRQPYHWAYGTVHGAEPVLVEIDTDAGVTGVGESVGATDAATVAAALARVTPDLIGHDAFDIARLVERLHRKHFGGIGPANQRRYSNQILTGVELALWDAVGKALGQPVHRLLGGAVRDEIAYFGFVQGDGPEEVGAHARELAEQGFAVIYLKVGRGDELDVANARAVRAAIGEQRRLWMDANEAWDTLTARRMIDKLLPFAPEFIEQPSAAESPSALARLRQAVSVPIAADQLVSTPQQVFEVCRHAAADVIVLGIHETGGIGGMRKAAAVAEAAGLNICLHGCYESGITTCASNQVAATLPNLDDGNQIMVQLLAEDVVAAPLLATMDGRLPVLEGPGLGFELDRDAVAGAAERYRIQAAAVG
ncbi:MAG: mandelate racemase/muconate lactonizing enzyme family protein [Geminicoccaceae bacterium]